MPTPGTWTALTNQPFNSFFVVVVNAVLMSDGTVLAFEGTNGSVVCRLTPDSSGSYINGTWTLAASMSGYRDSYTSVVLRDGRLVIIGGETAAAGAQTPTGEVYDPVANTWTAITPFPLGSYGDSPGVLLNDGTVLCGWNGGVQTYIYDPLADTWTATGSKIRSDGNSEEGFIKLPDGSVLTVETSTQTSTDLAQRYVPSSGTWVDAGVVPVTLVSGGNEIGPSVLVPDGRVFWLGSNGNTGHAALYTPSSNTWAAAAIIPGGLACDDAPACSMPNGNVLYAADTYNVTAPTKIFEYDPIADAHLDVTGSLPGMTFTQAFRTGMLMLPDGNVFLIGGSNAAANCNVYTPVGSPSSTWKPTISRIDRNSSDYTLHGTQLNGLSAGAAYGDDRGMDSNYPLITLTSGGGTVYFCTTHNWDIGVATGSTPVKTDFSLPAGLPAGTYSLRVVANGIASSPVNFSPAGATGLPCPGWAATPTTRVHSPAWAE